MLVGCPTRKGVAVTILGDGEACPATLVIRSGEPPEPGEELDARIMDPSEPSVTTYIFGFMPISDQMRSRYERASAPDSRWWVTEIRDGYLPRRSLI